MKIRSFYFLAAAGALLLTACNLPGGQSAEQVQTAAAETVSAQLTQRALLTPSATNTQPATATSTASLTPAVTNTPFATSTTSSGGATGGCDAAKFEADVTVPDGEDHAPDTAFVKTWRLRNIGTCSWSTSYSVVFVSGNSMGGPASQNLTVTVAPNTTVEVSINLKAPRETGSYTGYWTLKNATGQTFGDSFYVQIDVTGSGSTGGNGSTITASSVGQVDASGTPGSAAHAGANSGTGVQGFVSFNIASIPTDATIQEVKVDFSGFDTAGNPFASMGCLQGFAGSYFPLDAGDYNASGSGPDMEWCSTSDLSTVFINGDVADRLQDALGSATTLEYQLKFSGTPTGSALVRFLDGGVKLIITYTKP
ncbi:MAG: NBR1-Ig-like domain-containing protein [Chloroflexi bacterium]|nr:NBR1-Ig-like domain-containing protein [Chloroflexota bacterium]